MIKISPSILAADILHFYDDVKRIDDLGIDYLHVDIMDGVFVPNISYGPSIVSALESAFTTELDVHLMVQNPLKYIKTFAKAGSDIITVHQEIDEFEDCLAEIVSCGKRAGASIKPHTSVDSLKPYLEKLDLILIMSVEPGFGGQSFMPEVLSKISTLRQWGYKGIINIDGGINAQTGKQAIDAGADMLVMGTALFKAEDPSSIIKELRDYDKQ